MFKESLTDLFEAIKINSTYPNAHLEIGIIKMILADTAAACEYFNKSLEYHKEEAKEYIEKYCTNRK
jgi:hypothetical protein